MTRRGGFAGGPVLLIAALVLAAGASAEEALIQGMGRTVGWLAADSEGGLVFRDCQDRVHALGSARVAATDARCPNSSEKVTVEGRVVRVDRGRRVLLLEDSEGTPAGFYVGDAAIDMLGGLTPGAEVRVSGPAPGRAATIETF